MNIIKNILCLLIWAVATMSCTDRLESEYVAADKVSTNISVVVPNIPDAAPKTRAMAMAPQMQNLYLAVFDNNGYLLEYKDYPDAKIAREFADKFEFTKYTTRKNHGSI